MLLKRVALSSAVLFLAPAVVLANDVCSPLATQTCALPFPSDYFMSPDASSTTGARISVSNDLIRPEVLAHLPVQDGFSPEGVFNGSSGFSAASVVLFEFSQAPRARSLPADGGSAVMAFDLVTGNRVPIRTQLSSYARSDLVSAPSEVLEVFPRSRWEFGHRILVVVTKDLSVPNDASDFESKLAAQAEGSKGYEHLYELAETLLQAGVDPAQVRSATVFTVRDRAEVLDPIRNLVEDTFDNDHPVRNLNVKYNYFSRDKIAEITGELRLDNYRANGGTGNVDFTAEPMEQWTTFRLTMPVAARHGAAPVALYAHGLGANKESDTQMANMNAELGIATFSVDFPNHGDRAAADGGGVFDNLSVYRVPVQIGMVNQAPLDFASAQKALTSALADLDVVGKPTWKSFRGTYSDGVPDLDPQRLMMQGTSLGGVLGTAYAALAPDLDAAIFHVTGNGITSILSESVLWEGSFSNLLPSVATGAEALLLRAATQHAMDYGDAINYVDLLRFPDQPRSSRPTLILAGEGDNVVPNSATIATANLLDLPVIGPVLFDVPGSRMESDFGADGFGMRQYKPWLPTYLAGEDVSGSTAHVIFLRASAGREQEDWITRFFLQQP